MNRISINQPMLGPAEKIAVRKVLDSRILTSASEVGGYEVRQFEKAFERYLGLKHVIAVNSGTSALYASLLGLGIGPGDEVAVPSFSFVATANAVTLTGAKPLFVDISEEGYNMSPDDLEKRITPKTAAVIPVHLYGIPAEMKKVKSIAANHGLRVIEDAAQSLGTQYRGKQTGSLGDLGCFSFHASKVITSGEGGAIATDDSVIAARLRRIRTHGIGRDRNPSILGTNLRMGEVEGAILKVQLSRLTNFLDKRRRNALEISSRLSGERGVVIPSLSREGRPNWYIYTISLNRSRDHVLAKLRRSGVDARVYYETPIHQTYLYRKMGYRGVLANTERASKNVISLPVHPGVTLKQVREIVSILLKAIR
jgi:dTDP-4-amino-4,6-dideoxygalactose transaminase